MNDDIKITNIEATGAIEDIGIDAAKSIPAHYRYRYKQAIRYTLNNGTFEMGTVTAKTKPEMKNRLDRLIANATTGKMFAWYDNNTFIGTTVKY